MRTIPGFIILTAALAVAGCATMTVSSHIERGINFTDYRTYDWGAPDNLPVGDPRRVSGPAVVELDGSTCYVPPGWVGVRDGRTLTLTRA